MESGALASAQMLAPPILPLHLPHLPPALLSRPPVPPPHLPFLFLAESGVMALESLEAKTAELCDYSGHSSRFSPSSSAPLQQGPQPGMSGWRLPPLTQVRAHPQPGARGAERRRSGDGAPWWRQPRAPWRAESRGCGSPIRCGLAHSPSSIRCLSVKGARNPPKTPASNPAGN